MYRSNSVQNFELSNMQRIKYTSLMNAFENLGLTPSQSLDQNEYRLFLNNQSSSGYFDSTLCDKFFRFLNFNEKSVIPIPEFIQGFLLFEQKIKREAESSRIKLAKEQQIYNKILKQCIIHKYEKLNEEGFCEDAKIYGEIKDIDIRHKLEGIREIIIIVIFNNKKEELHFEIGDGATNIKKSFEFRPTSRKDHFEFIMKGVNDSGKVYNIGRKIFPLDDLESREKYLVQITVPDLDDPNKIAAFINIQIVLYMSYLHYYETTRKQQEKKMREHRIRAKQLFENLQNIRDIYGDMIETNYEINDGFYTERRGYTEEISLDDKLISHSKRSVSPKIGRKNIEYHYRSNYNSPEKLNIISEIKGQNRQLIQKRENIDISNVNFANNLNKKQRIQRYFLPKREINLEQGTKQKKLSSDYINKQNDFLQDYNKLNISLLNKQINYNNQINIDKNKYPQEKIESYSDYKKIIHQNNSYSNIHNYQQTKDKILQNISSSQNTKIKQQNIKNMNLGMNSQTQNKNIQIKGYNLNNFANTTSTRIQQSQNQIESESKEKVNINIKEDKQYDEKQKNVITEVARASVQQIIGEILKKDTITTETKFLVPIRKKTINMKHSVSDAKVYQKINKEIIEEKTLPVKYLPEKMNKLIYFNQIITLPIIFAGNKITYKNYKEVKPIIHEVRPFANEDEKNIYKNINLRHLNVNNNINNFDNNNKINEITNDNFQNNQVNNNFKEESYNLEKINQNNKLTNIQSSQ